MRRVVFTLFVCVGVWVTAVQADEAHQRGPTTFKEAADFVAAEGEDDQLNARFAGKLGFDTAGQPLRIKRKKDESDGKRFIGKVKDADAVILFWASADLKHGRAYIVRPDGTWIRGYLGNAVRPTPMTEAEADKDPKLGLSAMKKYWLAWLRERAK